MRLEQRAVASQACERLKNDLPRIDLAHAQRRGQLVCLEVLEEAQGDRVALTRRQCLERFVQPVGLGRRRVGVPCPGNVIELFKANEGCIQSAPHAAAHVEPMPMYEAAERLRTARALERQADARQHFGNGVVQNIACLWLIAAQPRPHAALERLSGDDVLAVAPQPHVDLLPLEFDLTHAATLGPFVRSAVRGNT